MKIVVKITYIVLSIILLTYLMLPNSDFPSPPSDSIQSYEPGDTESPLRRAYFTNFTREEVISSYKKQFEISHFLNIPIPTLRLNYPPEEAQILIRDQTRGTFLEELVHPLRESLFINGFEPTSNKDTIFIQGKVWRQKIIVKFVPSSPFVRVITGLSVLTLIPAIFTLIIKTLTPFRKK